MISDATRRALPPVALAIFGVVLIHSVGDAKHAMDHLPWELAWPRAIRCVFGFLFLATAWAWIVREACTPSGPTLRELLLLAIPVHMVAIWLPPFLSSDLMFYLAIGRGLSEGQAILQQVHGVPTPGLADSVVGHTSKYFPGFHVICVVLDWLGNHSVVRTMRLHQVLAALAVFGTAALSAVAVRRASVAGMLGASFERLLGGLEGDARAARGAATAAAVVLFSPLAVIEGTGNAHNDVYIALSIALFCVAVTLRRTGLALLALALGISIKASGVIPLAVFVGALVLAPLRERLAPRHRTVLFVGVALAGGCVAWLMIPLLAPYTRVFQQGPLSCTYQALECPIEWWLTQDGRLAARWVVGLSFRAAGGLFLLYAISRVCRDARPLGWIGVALFVFWVYFAGQSWCWYLLVVLPLLAFLPSGWFRGIVVGIASYPLSYAPTMIFSSLGRRDWQMACELVLTTLVPTLVIVWDLRRARRAGNAVPS